jgi:DNA repair protein endonuclease SAE2/CtIP C-terminus
MTSPRLGSTSTRGSNGSSSSSNEGDDSRYWSCPYCTLRNHTRRNKRCAACNKDRPSNDSLLTTENGSIDSSTSPVPEKKESSKPKSRKSLPRSSTKRVHDPVDEDSLDLCSWLLDRQEDAVSKDSTVGNDAVDRAMVQPQELLSSIIPDQQRSDDPMEKEESPSSTPGSLGDSNDAPRDEPINNDTSQDTNICVNQATTFDQVPNSRAATADTPNVANAEVEVLPNISQDVSLFQIYQVLMRMQKQMDRIEDQQRLLLGQSNVSPQALDNRRPLPSSMVRSNAETIKDADEMPMSTSDAIPKQDIATSTMTNTARATRPPSSNTQSTKGKTLRRVSRSPAVLVKATCQDQQGEQANEPGPVGATNHTEKQEKHGEDAPRANAHHNLATFRGQADLGSPVGTMSSQDKHEDSPRDEADSHQGPTSVPMPSTQQSVQSCMDDCTQALFQTIPSVACQPIDQQEKTAMSNVVSRADSPKLSSNQAPTSPSLNSYKEETQDSSMFYDCDLDDKLKSTEASPPGRKRRRLETKLDDDAVTSPTPHGVVIGQETESATVPTAPPATNADSRLPSIVPPKEAAPLGSSADRPEPPKRESIGQRRRRGIFGSLNLFSRAGLSDQSVMDDMPSSLAVKTEIPLPTSVTAASHVVDERLAGSEERPAKATTPNGSESTCWTSNEPARRFLRELDGNAEERNVGPMDDSWMDQDESNGLEEKAKMIESGKENERNGSTSFRYQEVVRCQHERRGLPQRDCPECKAFYEALKRTGHDMKDWQENSGLVKLPSFLSESRKRAIAQRKETGLQSIHEDHPVVAEGTGQPTDSSSHVAGRPAADRPNQKYFFSRHRSRFTPPETPDDFWSLDFADEKRKALAEGRDVNDLE